MRASVVEAVIVNHNTSLFSELALRSLVASEEADPCGAHVRVTIRDNHSDDQGLDALRAAAVSLGADFEPSRWPARQGQVNSHGDVLRDFVLDHPDASYFLFLDCDIDVEEPGTLGVMLHDLEASPDLWAVQARFGWSEETNGPDTSLDIWSGRRADVMVGVDVAESTGVKRFGAQVQPRLHPGCALIRNSLRVRRVAERFGFGVAVVQSGDERVAGLFDTAGLASAVLAVTGMRYALSRATVHHFFNVTSGEDRDRREADCRERLGRFRVIR